MSGDDLEEPLEAFAALLDDLVGEAAASQGACTSSVTLSRMMRRSPGHPDRRPAGESSLEACAATDLPLKTLPGNGGMLTRCDSRSRISRNASKSEYRRRTDEYRTRNAGMLVCQKSE